MVRYTHWSWCYQKAWTERRLSAESRNGKLDNYGADSAGFVAEERRR